MTLLALFLSLAQASPKKGLRGTICAGNSSDCPVAQIGLMYVNNRFGVGVGGLPFPLGVNVGFQYYLSDSAKDTRYFIGTSAGGSISGFYDMAAIGLKAGVDVHIFESRRTILTPRIGMDYVSSSGLFLTKDASFRPTLSLQISRSD